MKTKQKTNWWIDLVLFTGFLLTFFLDLTGVELHQWIGIFGGLLAAYHLLIHREWVDAVGRRFFGWASGKTRLYFAIDMALLTGFALMVATGLVISTWLNLSLANYNAWLTVHIIGSIVTLATLLVKLALHWRWIARVAQDLRVPPVAVPQRALAPQPVKANGGHMGRREFLQVMGVVGAASFLALAGASKSLAELAGNVSGAIGNDTNAGAQASQDTSTTSQERQSDFSQSASSSSSNCTVQCGKRCSYPGHCHRYVDSNGNNRCDFGECL